MSSEVVDAGLAATRQMLAKFLPMPSADERARVFAEFSLGGGDLRPDYIIRQLLPGLTDGVDIGNAARLHLAVEVALLWQRLRDEPWYTRFVQLRVQGVSMEHALQLAQGLAVSA
jgi:hypothetical protein